MSNSQLYAGFWSKQWAIYRTFIIFFAIAYVTYRFQESNWFVTMVQISLLGYTWMLGMIHFSPLQSTCCKALPYLLQCLDSLLPRLRYNLVLAHISLSLSLSLSHTRTRTRTRAHTHTHTHTHTVCLFVFICVSTWSVRETGSTIFIRLSYLISGCCQNSILTTLVAIIITQLTRSNAFHNPHNI